MLKKQLKKLFNLEGYILDKAEEADGKILLHCHLQKKSMKYKSETSKTVNTIQKRELVHSMLEDKKVFIVVDQRKFYFSKHGKRLWEPLPQVKRKQHMTAAFKKTL
jgi:hypothetical protein